MSYFNEAPLLGHLKMQATLNGMYGQGNWLMSPPIKENPEAPLLDIYKWLAHANEILMDKNKWKEK